MSIDISHLGAHLSDAQRAAVQTEYERQAKSPTAAFLLCFFLGIFGAHRFYLGQTGAGLLRLILSPLLIPGIIWEIYDLLHIDGEVHTRNLKLAEHLIAGAALAAPLPAAVAAHIHMAGPRADQPAVTIITPISGEPAKAAELSEPATVMPAPAPDTDAPPVWPVAPAIATAAVLAASEAAATPAPATPAGAASDAADDLLPAAPGMDITADMVSTAAAFADAAAPIAPGQAAAFAPADDLFAAAPVIEESAVAAAGGAATDTTTDTPIAAAETVAPGYTPRLNDPTDRGPDTGELFALADLGEPTGERVVVRLPSASAPAPAPDWSDMAPAAPVTLPDASAPDASPLVVPGDADVPDYAESMALPLAAEGGALLLVPVESAAPEPPESPEPSAALDVSPIAEAPEGDAPAADAAETQVSEEAFDRFTDTGSHRIIKRVKVVRRLVVNGQVIEEATAEQVVDAGADTAATARSLQESLRGNDFQQRIAALSAPLAPPPAAATPAPPDQPSTGTTSQTDTPADQPAGS